MTVRLNMLGGGGGGGGGGYDDRRGGGGGRAGHGGRDRNGEWDEARGAYKRDDRGNGYGEVRAHLLSILSLSSTIFLYD